MLSSDDDFVMDREDRKNFVFKVYLILSALLSFTLGMCVIANTVLPVKRFFVQYYWLSFIFMLVYLIVFLVLVCVGSARKTFPLNLFLLFLLVVSLTVPLCVMTAVYSTRAVVLALATTVVIAFTVSLMAKICPFDVTGWGMLVCILASAFIIYSLVNLILSLFIYSPLMQIIFGGVGTVIYSFFLFFDTQQIMGGRRVEIDTDEYILGVILLYTDIIMIFVLLLRVFEYSGDD